MITDNIDTNDVTLISRPTPNISAITKDLRDFNTLYPNSLIGKRCQELIDYVVFLQLRLQMTEVDTNG